MGLLTPEPPPYDPLEWAQRPFPERARMACQSWATQGYGTPIAVYFVYALKVALYIGGWMAACAITPTLGGPSEVATWWLHPLAFQKAIVWSALFEVLGLGCGSGPLTGRYAPPIGGALYFLRPGTTRLPLFPRAPLLRGVQRTWLDALLYLAMLASFVAFLVHPAPGRDVLLPMLAVTAALGLRDKTILLATRGEHYLVTIVVFTFASNWIPGAKAVHLALWFWAGVSKLNHHFPAVVCVMTSNSPLTKPLPWLRRAVYRQFPEDLRPSRLAAWMGHAGTALEFAVPTFLLLGDGGPTTTIGLALMLLLHGYITSNIPMGVPIEWNFMMVYGGLVLFYGNAHVSLLELDAPLIGALLVCALIVVPLVGNLAPAKVSFLPSMRYYAGNWAYSIWLFRGESYRKLDQHLVKSAPWVADQLERFYDHATAVGLMGKVMAFRLMHLHGRALHGLLPKAVDQLDDYEWVDGEILAGLVLGWNFGDGHLHDERLLAAVQAQCGYEAGELRCIMVEAQPLFGRALTYRIHDARRGLMDAGSVSIAALRARSPWPPDTLDERPS
ncbi:MAG: DUF3556 domain-containing protein [Myxococcales bacterium]|nr:DUF3556 domain-containing protein [Myxococcales bacterium]